MNINHKNIYHLQLKIYTKTNLKHLDITIYNIMLRNVLFWKPQTGGPLVTSYSTFDNLD